MDGQGNYYTDGIGYAYATMYMDKILIENIWGYGIHSSSAYSAIDSLEIRNVRTGSESAIDHWYGNIAISNSKVVDCKGDIGGGLYVFHGSAQVSNMMFINNLAERGGGAVAVEGDEAHAIFSDCSFVGNDSENDSGGGIACFYRSSIEVTNCTFTGNYDEAISISMSGSEAVVINTLIAHNPGHGVRVNSGTLTMTCCNVFGNDAGNFEGVDDPTGTDGNISEEPMFCNLGGGEDPLTISVNSPCLPENNDCGVLIGNSAADCDLEMFAISGHIENEEGLPLSGVELSGHYQNYYTDDFGDYVIPSVEGWSGVISPYFESYHFEPRDRSYSSIEADQLDQDFLAYYSTLHLVPEEFPSIGEALAIALSGDTILVSPGLYEGENNRDLTFRGEDVVLMSIGGSDQTVLDCQESGRGFLVHLGETSAATIEGFTILNGRATEELTGGSRGGGLLIHGASPTLRDLVIQDCHAVEGNGGGMAIEDCASIMNGIHFIGNEAPGQYGNGGGLHMKDSSPSMAYCFFHRNYAYRYGGAICALESPFNILHTTIVGNIAGWEGGALAGNQLTGSLFLAAVFALNRATGGGAAFHGSTNYQSDFECSVFFDNGEVPYTGNFDDPVGSNDNYEVDPLFCDPENGDFKLTTDSPCLPDNNPCGILIGTFGAGCP